MAMEKEALTNTIESDLAKRNRNWDKVDTHLAEDVSDNVHGLANAVIVDSGNNQHGRYIKFGDGTIIMYMKPYVLMPALSQYSTEATVILPISFVDTDYMWVATQGDIHGSYIAATAVFGQGATKNISGFTLFAALTQVNGGASFEVRPNIIAIGRWK